MYNFGSQAALDIDLPGPGRLLIVKSGCFLRHFSYNLLFITEL